MSCFGKSCTAASPGLLPVEFYSRSRTAKNITPGFLNRRRTIRAYPNLKGVTGINALRQKLYNVIAGQNDDATAINAIRLILSKMPHAPGQNLFDQTITITSDDNITYKMPLIVIALIHEKANIAKYLIENGTPLTFPATQSFVLPPNSLGIQNNYISAETLIVSALEQNMYDVARAIINRELYHISGYPYMMVYTYHGAEAKEKLQFLEKYGINKSKVTSEMIGREADTIISLLGGVNNQVAYDYIGRLKELGLDMRRFAGIDVRSLESLTINILALDTIYKLGIPVSPDIILHTVAYYNRPESRYIRSILDVLVKYGANINAANEGGNVIHHLVSFPEVGSEIDEANAQLLEYIRIDIDIRAKDGDGKTAADVALHRGMYTTYTILVAFGGDYSRQRHTDNVYHNIYNAFQNNVLYWLNKYRRDNPVTRINAAISLGRIAKGRGINIPNIKSRVLSFVSQKEENAAAKNVEVFSTDTIWDTSSRVNFSLAFRRLKRMIFDINPDAA